MVAARPAINLGGMNRTFLNPALTLALVAWLTGLPIVQAGDWMTYRSTYTHDAQGLRVDQHTRPVEPLSPDQGNLVRSGYRNYRSTIQGSTSADNLHITHEWGRPVMPYEHWRFPYRPFGAPYDQWGPPVPNVLSNFNNYQNNVGPVLPNVPFGNNGPMGNGGPGNGVLGNGVLGNGSFGNGPFGNGNGSFGNNFYPGFGSPQPGNYPGYNPGFNSVNPSAPWVDGLYPSAPPLR